MRSRAAVPAVVVLAALLGGCASAPAAAATPDGALAALAAAVDDGDDDAVDRLICPAHRDDGESMSRFRDGLVELDPAFAGSGWHAEPGPIRSTTATGATGSLIVTTTGRPATDSPEVSEFLDGVAAPRPMNLLGAGGEITLVAVDGHWLACR